MRVVFVRPGSPEDVVGAADWDGRRVHVRADDPDVRAGIERVFRATPIVADDPSLRAVGTSGDVLLHPGTLEWFRAAAFGRAAEVGLAARAVTTRREGGWDPAAQYRRFRDQVARLVDD